MQREHIVVREANNGDLEGLLDLYTGFYSELRSRQGLRPRSREEYRNEVERYLSRDKIFLAETGSGEAVGFIRVSTREGCYWFEELYVKPRRRGRGIGRMLVERAEEYVKRHDPYVYIMVLPQDRRALGFWLHMGYRLLNTIELAKNLEGEEEETRPLPLLSHILEIYRWPKEDYTPLEKRFLELVEEFQRRGGSGKELLKVLVSALEKHLPNT
ncbi:MAG: GNAT family N-acetyltransferase [Desulfurococcales archaeon]|nr:GNAT family N-acetyltransferase [Desulfurococcales archaeon]